MFCKKCGKEVEDTWKVCPNCGEPIIKETTEYAEHTQKDGKQENMGKEKKPIFKRIWFWILLIIIAAVIVSVLGNSGESKEEPQKKEEKEIQTNMSDLDMEDFFGQNGVQLEELGFEKNEETGEYTALDGAVYVSCTNDTVDAVMLEGTGEDMPAFHGVKTGMSLNEAEALLAETYMPAGQTDNRTVYLNMDKGVSIGLETSEDEITRIIITKISQEEISSYMQSMYVFPDSDKKYLSEDEVRSVEVDKLAIGRNEIFARHGYIFGDENYKQYFESMPWYEGTVPADQFNADEVFNDFEKKNVELIKKVEDEINGVNQASSFIGMDGWYTCITGSEGITGHINVQTNGDGTVNLTFRILEMSYDILSVQGVVIDNTTIQADYYGYIITLTWTDAENMTITKQGELSGTDSGIIMDITDNQSYLRTAEFNQW